MWSCQLVTFDLYYYFPGQFCPCNIVVVFEMYSLIGSLVIMRDCEAGAHTGTFAVHHDSNTGGLSAKWACTWFKNGSHVFRSHVHSSHVLRPSMVTHSRNLDISTCNVICRRHDDPKNGPTGDPSIVRLP